MSHGLARQHSSLTTAHKLLVLLLPKLFQHLVEEAGVCVWWAGNCAASPLSCLLCHCSLSLSSDLSPRGVGPVKM